LWFFFFLRCCTGYFLCSLSLCVALPIFLPIFLPHPLGRPGALHRTNWLRKSRSPGKVGRPEVGELFLPRRFLARVRRLPSHHGLVRSFRPRQWRRETGVPPAEALRVACARCRERPSARVLEGRAEQPS